MPCRRKLFDQQAVKDNLPRVSARYGIFRLSAVLVEIHPDPRQKAIIYGKHFSQLFRLALSPELVRQAYTVDYGFFCNVIMHPDKIRDQNRYNTLVSASTAGHDITGRLSPAIPASAAEVVMTSQEENTSSSR